MVIVKQNARENIFMYLVRKMQLHIYGFALLGM